MTDRPVAVYDSGVGGLPYYAHAREKLPAEDFVYLADTANFPFGEKSVAELRRIVVESVGRLIAATDPKVVVVACNTASVVALEALRNSYPLPFVGVVPAIKPAAAASKTRSIALLATARTVGDHYTDKLIGDFAAGCSIARVADGTLVRFVENRILTASVDERRAAAAAAVAPLLHARVDTVVLGCTHFVYLADEIAGALGDGVSVLDSRDGVVRQLARITGRRESPAGTRSMDRFYVTGFRSGRAESGASDGVEQDIALYRAFAERFDMAYAGSIEEAADVGRRTDTPLPRPARSADLPL
ncbi:glutamate racemase [Salinispira pacifica]